jgi:cytochrome P450
MTAAEPDSITDDSGYDSFDETSAAYVRDPYPEFARLRVQSPVTRQESAFVGGPPSYVVYRHADVTAVLRDGETYSSTIIGEGMGQVWGPKIIVGMDEPEHHRHRASSLWLSGNEHLPVGKNRSLAGS